VAQVVRRDGVARLNPAQDAGFLPFIDAGHFTRYLTVGAIICNALRAAPN
jgi:hypothetical protein